MQTNELIKKLEKELTSFRLRGSNIAGLIKEAIKMLKQGHSFPDNVTRDEYVEMLEDKIIQLEKQLTQTNEKPFKYQGLHNYTMAVNIGQQQTQEYYGQQGLTDAEYSRQFAQAQNSLQSQNNGLLQQGDNNIGSIASVVARWEP